MLYVVKMQEHTSMLILGLPVEQLQLLVSGKALEKLEQCTLTHVIKRTPSIFSFECQHFTPMI